MIATMGAGIFIIYLGYLIGIKKLLTLIIGYSDNTFYGDKDKYAKRIGMAAILLGMIVITMPLAVLFLGEGALSAYKYVIGVYVLIMIVGANYWRIRF